MKVQLEIPDTLEQMIRASGADVATVVREAALVEFYRQGKLSHGQLARALGVTRTRVDEILKRFNVTSDMPTFQEIEDQVATLRRMAG